MASFPRKVNTIRLRILSQTKQSSYYNSKIQTKAIQFRKRV